jgi:TonB family protein
MSKGLSAILLLLMGLATAQDKTPHKMIQNIAPEEMWSRVKQCLFPAYPELASNSHIGGTVDIGLGISPKGDVDNPRVLSGHPVLIPSAVDAIRRWKFQPNVVEGEATWSRVRALARFNADGTTTVELAPAILADNFGDPGTPRSAALAVPRPETAPACPVNASVDMNPVAAPLRPADNPQNVTNEAGTKQVRISPQVSQGLLLYKVQPIYPHDAMRNHIQGAVVLHAIIDKNGRISNLKALSGPKELTAAAISAVEQWRYRPYSLEGGPIEVQTEITVNFQLQ